ncbi:MAG: hypothetical protein H0U76_13110, partial [Ktedonobacteraceae bacterium]|nr:hypothetical protein [Ktedonobacteraceae bacterium]
MTNQTSGTLATYVERARKVLQHEQRTNHQDRAIKPGGLEAFTVRWYEEASTLCKSTGQDIEPFHRFAEHLEGYRRQDTMQRAASLRAALAILNELDENDAQSSGSPVPTVSNQIAPGPVARQAQSSKQTQSSRETEQRLSEAPSASLSHTSIQQAPTKPIRSDDTTPLEHSNNGYKKIEQKGEMKKGASRESAQEANSIQLEAGMSQGHTALTLLRADITAVPGVGPSAATRLHTLGIRTVQDLLFYFPREHRDYSRLEKIANVPFNELTTTMGLIWEVKTQRINNGRTRTIATISDETGKLYVSWFNQGYLQKQLQAAHGDYLVVTGIKQRFGNKVEFSVRSHELPEQGDLLNTGRMVPIYPLTEGLHAKTLRRFTKYVVDRYAQMLPEHLPLIVRMAGELMPLPEAVAQIHYPDNEEMRAKAHRRLAFDEIFMIQLGMQERRSRWQHEAKEGNAFNIRYERIFIEPPAGQESQEVVQEAPALSSTLWSVIAID